MAKQRSCPFRCGAGWCENVVYVRRSGANISPATPIRSLTRLNRKEPRELGLHAAPSSTRVASVQFGGDNKLTVAILFL
jgi:hypothetical protein